MSNIIIFEFCFKDGNKASASFHLIKLHEMSIFLRDVSIKSFESASAKLDSNEFALKFNSSSTLLPPLSLKDWQNLIPPLSSIQFKCMSSTNNERFTLSASPMHLAPFS